MVCRRRWRGIGGARAGRPRIVGDQFGEDLLQAQRGDAEMAGGGRGEQDPDNLIRRGGAHLEVGTGHLHPEQRAGHRCQAAAHLVRAGEPRPAGGYRGALAEPADLVHRPVGHDSAVIDDHYPVGGIGGFLQIVGGEQDRPAVCRLGAHGAPESRSGGGIQARGRLVQDQQFGLAQQGERQPDALDLAAGAFGDPAVQQPAQIGLGDDRGRRGRPHL